MIRAKRTPTMAEERFSDLTPDSCRPSFRERICQICHDQRVQTFPVVMEWNRWSFHWSGNPVFQFIYRIDKCNLGQVFENPFYYPSTQEYSSLLLAHGFAKQSAVCYTPCRRCRGQGVCESPRPSPCASACGLTSTNRESGFSASPPVLFHSRAGLLFLPPLYPAAS